MTNREVYLNATEEGFGPDLGHQRYYDLVREQFEDSQKVNQARFGPDLGGKVTIFKFRHSRYLRLDPKLARVALVESIGTNLGGDKDTRIKAVDALLHTTDLIATEIATSQQQ